MSENLVVVLWCWRPDRTFKWKGSIEYNPALANRQARAISAQLSMPHEVAVISDYPAHEFGSHVRYIPLWDDCAGVGQCYRRLRAFAPDMREVIGPRFVWVDLDVLVVGRLDPLFSHQDDFRIWKSESVPGQPYNGSLVQMTAGARAKVWTDFDPNVTPRRARDQGYKGSDQSAIAQILGAGEKVWTYADGVLHATIHCTRRKPEHGRLIFTPGRMKPDMLRRLRGGQWMDEFWGADEPALAGAKPWAVGPSAPGPRRRAGRPTMHDLRREARARQKLGAM